MNLGPQHISKLLYRLTPRSIRAQCRISILCHPPVHLQDLPSKPVIATARTYILVQQARHPPDHPLFLLQRQLLSMLEYKIKTHATHPQVQIATAPLPRLGGVSGEDLM